MAVLHLVGVSGPAGADPPRVTDITVSVEAGEVMAIVGPSGAGKSSLLRLTAGLDTLATGAIYLDDEPLHELPVAQRRVGMVTADGALRPDLDVAGNVEFPLRLQRVGRSERRRRARIEAGVLGLRRVLGRKPATLSAGHRQAAALARETIRLPSVMLLDEPTARLDAARRAHVRRELARYVRALGAPTLLATNDQVEAMALGDRLVVLHQGRIEQVGEPQTVYDEPATAFVAGFLGQPGANVLPGRIEVGARTVQVRVGDGSWTVQATTGPVRRLDTAQVTVAIRPEHLVLDAPPETGRGVPARVTHVERLGTEALVHLRVAAVEPPVVARVHGEPPAVGTKVRLAVVPERIAVFDRVDGSRHR